MMFYEFLSVWGQCVFITVLFDLLLIDLQDVAWWRRAYLLHANWILSKCISTVNWKYCPVGIELVNMHREGIVNDLIICKGSLLDSLLYCTSNKILFYWCDCILLSWLRSNKIMKKINQIITWLLQSAKGLCNNKQSEVVPPSHCNRFLSHSILHQIIIGSQTQIFAKYLTLPSPPHADSNHPYSHQATQFKTRPLCLIRVWLWCRHGIDWWWPVGRGVFSLEQRLFQFSRRICRWWQCWWGRLSTNSMIVEEIPLSHKIKQNGGKSPGVILIPNGRICEIVMHHMFFPGTIL